MRILLTLFGTLGSGNVHKVQMILRRIGESYRRVDVAQTCGEPRKPEFLELNPMGKVPAVLHDNGRALTESGAILYHFAQRISLWPKSADARTEVLRWMFFEQYSHEPTLAVIRYLRHFVDEPHRHVDSVTELGPGAGHALGVMETRLGSSDWPVSCGCTIADYALYPYTRSADSAGFHIDEFPCIGGWLARVESQPGFIPLGNEGAVETLTFMD